MAEPGLTVLGWMSGTGYRLVLLLGLLSATLVGWHAWRRTRTATARAVWLGAASVLGCLALWTLFGTLARVTGLDARLWAAPLDRLLGVAILVALGWTLCSPDLDGRRWRLFLGSGLAVAAVAYLGWAPLWAQSFHANAALTREPTGLARAWDAWQLVLALAVGIALLRGARGPRWLLLVVGGLALGSLLELVVPLSATVPAWSRLGTLVAGTILVAAAVNQAAALRPALDVRWPLSPVRRSRHLRPAATATLHRTQVEPEAELPPPAPVGDLSPVLEELARQSAAIGGLTQVVEGLGSRLDGIERGLVAQPVAAADDDSAASPPPAPHPRSSSTLSPHPPATAETADLTVAAVAALEAARAATPAATAGEGEVAARAQRYAQALERLPWGVVVADAEDRVSFANAAAAHRLHVRQIEPGELVAALFPNQDRAGYALHRARSQTDDTTAAIEILFESPGLRVVLEPLRDPVLGYLGAVLVLHTPSVDSAGPASRLVPDLAGSLRAPMTSILGYSELLGRMGSLSEDQIQRYLQRIDANLSRMQVMLGNLLTVVNLAADADAPALAPEPIDLEAAAHAALERARPQLDEKGLVATVVVDGPLPPASAHPQAVTQILDNLVANAALRSPQGGDITLQIEVRDSDDGQRAVVLTVSDRGSPLAASPVGVLEIDETPQREVALSVVRLLAERLGGRAWAESDTRGARLHLRLPARRTG